MKSQVAFVALGTLILSTWVRADGQAKYAGLFLNDRISVELKEAGDKYTGTIRIGQKSYPLTARDTWRYLEGTFVSDNESFEFTITIADDQINLRSGDASYDLKRAAVRTVPANRLAPDPRNPLAGATPPAGAAADPAKLKAQIEEILQAVRDDNVKLLRTHVDKLKLPNHKAWFAETFGPEVGGRVAKEYAAHLAKFQKEIQGLFQQAVKEGRTVIQVDAVQKPDDREATGLQDDALKAMKTPRALYTLHLSKRGREASMSVRSFVLVDGAFRLIGDMRSISEPAGGRPSPAPVGPPVAPPAPAPGSGVVAPAPAAAPRAPAGATGVLRFKKLHVKDDLIGTEAFSMLIPADWRAQGGVVWRRNPFKPATAAMRVASPDGLTQFEILPQMPFVDGARETNMQAVRMAGSAAIAAMAERFAEGQLYFGNEVRQRVDDPALFVRQFVLPRFRAELRDLRIVKVEDMPKVAEAIAAAEPAEEASRKTVRVGRTRIEFSLGRQAFEEDIYCVLLLVEIPAIRQTYWSAEHLLAFRAPRGQLDGRIQVLRTICNSFRIDLKWYNKYSQLVATLVQGQIKEIQAVGEFSRKWAQMSDEISRDRQKSWEDRQARQDEMNRRYSQYQRGLQDYRDADGNRVELPAGYNNAWISRGGEYIMTDNPNFNPNVEFNGTWTPMAKAN